MRHVPFVESRSYRSVFQVGCKARTTENADVLAVPAVLKRYRNSSLTDIVLALDSTPEVTDPPETMLVIVAGSSEVRV